MSIDTCMGIVLWRALKSIANPSAVLPASRVSLIQPLAAIPLTLPYSLLFSLPRPDFLTLPVTYTSAHTIPRTILLLTLQYTFQKNHSIVLCLE